MDEESTLQQMSQTLQAAALVHEADLNEMETERTGRLTEADLALDRLRGVRAYLAAVVENTDFAELSDDEMAAALGLSDLIVRRKRFEPGSRLPRTPLPEGLPQGAAALD